MPREKSPRNKTIATPISEGAEYLERVITIAEPLSDILSVTDKTVHGDALEVCPLLPRECFDLIIADPPYNLSKVYAGARFGKMSRESYEAYTAAWLDAVIPLLRPSGTLYVCCDWDSGLTIGRLLEERLTVRNRITWQREKGRGAQANWKNGLEDIWFATKSDSYTFNLDSVKIRRRVLAPYREDGKPKDWVEAEGGAYRDTCPSNFWDDVTVPFWSMPENTAHPTQKPEKLMAKLILASSNPGDTVFDPFLGSGTTSVAAKKLGRHYLGIEKEPQYCLWAEQRLQKADSDKSIQGYADSVFWDRNSFSMQQKSGAKPNVSAPDKE